MNLGGSGSANARVMIPKNGKKSIEGQNRNSLPQSTVQAQPCKLSRGAVGFQGGQTVIRMNITFYVSDPSRHIWNQCIPDRYITFNILASRQRNLIHKKRNVVISPKAKPSFDTR